MRPLALNDLPAHSGWARYLLDPAGDPPSDPEAYTSDGTYDEMYGHLLDEYRSSPAGPDGFARRIYAKGREDPGAVSVRGDLYLASPGELLELERFAVAVAFAGLDTEPDTVLDLGCGWGAALGPIAETCPGARVVGGERSEAGVELARELAADRDRVTVERFDLRDDWELLDRAAGETVLFTRGVLTTLADADAVVDRIASLAEAGVLSAGVHLEQVDAHPGTTLGLLRRHYGRIRGYDGSVLDSLERRETVEVTDAVYDAVGPNPLHPRTLLRWRAV